MKRNIKLLSFLALSFGIIFSSCNGGDDPSPEEQKIEELSGTWNIVEGNGEALSGVSITFTVENTTYAITGLDIFTDANLNHDETLGDINGEFSLNQDLDVVTLSPGGNLNINNINKENGDLTLSYQAPFPKASDDPTTIILELKLAE